MAQTKSNMYEGHDENSPRPSLGKGEYFPVGTTAPLRTEPAHSPDKKGPVKPYPNE